MTSTGHMTPALIVILALSLTGCGRPAAPVQPRANNRNVVNTGGLNANMPEQVSIDWEAILIGAKLKQSLKYGEYNFEIPANMDINRNIDGSPGMVVADWPEFEGTEGPSLTFNTWDKNPASVIADQKAALSQYEQVLDTRSVEVHGAAWEMIRYSTDFGIDGYLWVAANPTKTGAVSVSYPAFDDIIDLFQQVINSSQPTSS